MSEKSPETSPALFPREKLTDEVKFREGPSVIERLAVLSGRPRLRGRQLSRLCFRLGLQMLETLDQEDLL